MAWYYWGMGFNSAAAKSGAKKLEKKYTAKTKIVKSKDRLGGNLYKIYLDKNVKY